MSLTASSLERIYNCPGSEALPHVKRHTDAAEAGSAVHAFLEACLTTGAAAALSAVPAKYHDLCAIIALEKLPHGSKDSYAAEVTFALDVETFECRELGRNLGRRYVEAGAKPTEVVGTPDVVGVSDDAVVVFDVKTGWQYQAADSWQMRFNGAAAALTYGKSVAHLLTLIIHDDEIIRVAHVMESPDFAAVLSDVADLYGRVATITPATARHHLALGPWCRFCPALAACPAQVGLIRELALHPASSVPASDIAKTLTVPEAAETWRKIKAAKVIIDRLDEAVRLFAERQPVPVGNGKVLGLRERQTEYLDGGITYAVLAEKHGREVADAAVEMKASKSAIKDAMRKLAASTGAKMSDLEADVLEEVRRLGGSRVRTTASVVEYAAPKGEAAT